MIRALLILALLPSSGGCGSTSEVDLTIVADANVTPATLANVRHLVFVFSGVHDDTRSYPLTALSPRETVQLLPKATRGILTIDVRATDSAMNVLAKGHSEVRLTGDVVAASLTLSVPPAPLTITPPRATVTRGRTQQFTANVPVTWTVTGNGSIDRTGLYTAPRTPGGPVTIVATSTADSSDNAQAMVNVVDYGVELLAGGLGGAGEVDGSGTSARFTKPYAVAADGNGFLYIAEFIPGVGRGCTLRKVDVRSMVPVATLFGGVPGQCFDVDGKLGLDARFQDIRALAVDAAATTLWVVEIGAIRRVTLATGDVTTLQVGSPPGPPVTGLAGIAIDNVHNDLYVSSQGANTIHKISLAGPGADTLFAGITGISGSTDAPSGPATAATFNIPQRLAFDGTNLWVADRDNHLLRKIVVATGAVTTVAGVAGQPGNADGVGSVTRLDGPIGLTFGATTDTLYITDAADGLVRAFSVSTGFLSTVAGVAHADSPGLYPATDDPVRGRSATFGIPHDLAFDGFKGALFVIEMDNAVLRSIGLFASNPVTTVAGAQAQLGNKDDVGTSARFWNIGTIASDGHAVYLSDNHNATIRAYDLATGAVSTIAGQAGRMGGDDGPAMQATFLTPEGLVLDGTNLYISDGGASTIRKLDLQTRMVSTIAGQYKTQGAADGFGSGATFTYPLYLAGDGADHLYVADASSPILRRVTISSGEVKTIAGDQNHWGFTDGTGSAASFAGPYGLAVDGGALYVCDSTIGFAGIRKIDLSSFAVTTIAGGPSSDTITDGAGTGAKIASCFALASNGQGRLYFGDDGELRQLDLAVGKVSTVVGMPFKAVEAPGPLAAARVNMVSGLAVLPSGDVLFSDKIESSLFLVRAP